MDEKIMNKIIEQQGEELLLAGALILTIGTVISAAGQTRLVTAGDISGKESVVIGNSVEAFGNALQGVGRGKINTVDPSIPGQIAEAGCWLQAAGNVTNAVGIQQEINAELAEEELEDDDEEEREFLESVQDNGEQINALGSTVQAGGALLEAYGVANMKPSIATPYEVVGNVIIAFGSAVDAIGSVYILQEQENTGEWIELAGSYIQVIGSAIELYGVTIASTVPKQEENERYSYRAFNKRFM